jgi:hypothetical protein
VLLDPVERAVRHPVGVQATDDQQVPRLIGETCDERGEGLRLAHGGRDAMACERPDQRVGCGKRVVDDDDPEATCHTRGLAGSTRRVRLILKPIGNLRR